MNLKGVSLKIWRGHRAFKVVIPTIFLILLALLCTWTGLDALTSKLEEPQPLALGLITNRNSTVSGGKEAFIPTKDEIKNAREYYYKLLDQSLLRLDLMPLERPKIENTSIYSGPSGYFMNISSARTVQFNSYLATDRKDDGDICEHMKFGQEKSTRSTEIKISEAKPLGDDVNISAIKRYLNISGYGEDVPKVDTSNMENDCWYRFAGSAIWLEDQQCYFEVDRIMYAPESRSSPWLSLIWMQLFDKDFNEIKSKRLRFMDLSGEEIESILSELGNFNATENIDRREKLLDKISTKFPAVMDISFITEDFGRPQGPEDPRIFARLDKNGKTEPVVVFNQINDREQVAMYAGFPLRRNREQDKHGVPTVEFNFGSETNLEFKPIEKNWMPFIEDPEDGDKISFIYELDPLAILHCTLHDGICDVAQKIKAEPTEIETGVSLRGGTNLIAIPSSIVQEIFTKEQTEGNNVGMWVSFLKYHGWESGCGSSTYRPALLTLVRYDDKYKIEMMSGAFDFGMDVLSFDGKSVKCDDDGPNVLSPNSIPFWKITKVGNLKETDNEKRASEKTQVQNAPNNENDHKEEENKEMLDSNSPEYKDLMGLTISEADRNVKYLVISNIINYVMEAFKTSSLSRLGSFDESIYTEMVDIEKCAVLDFLEYCKEYEKTH